MSYLNRLCERCGKQLGRNWEYGWCEDCSKWAVCTHGNRPEDCNACMIEADIEYDAQRGARGFVPERTDEP